MMTNNRPLFSIFVPIYNAEKYLVDCIESVLVQTFDSWEMILVDDGSTDNSGRICEEYAKRDSRIKCIHKENGGEFSSRYAAMIAAVGEYATGLDADDKYVPDYLETIAAEIEKGKYDCIKWSFTLFGQRNESVRLPANSIGEYSGKDYLSFIVRSTLHSFCSQAIKLDILKGVDYTDVPKVRMSEDYIMVVPALCYIKNAKVINYYGYLYRIHDNSASNRIEYTKLYDLCEVSKYGIKKIAQAGLLNKELKKGEHLAFLRCIWPRLEIALSNNVLTDEQIRSIRKHESYVNSKDVEKIAEFGKRQWLKMKLFRNGHVVLLKRLCK